MTQPRWPRRPSGTRATLQITTSSDQEVRLTRLFDAGIDGMAVGYDRLDGVFAQLAR